MMWEEEEFLDTKSRNDIGGRGNNMQKAEKQETVAVAHPLVD